MAPLPRLDSTIPRQLAPTVGREMSGVTFRPGSTGGVSDTIAVGLVSYFAKTGAGHVLNDGFWMPAKEDPAGWSTVSIGGFDIFVGFIAKALDDLGFTSSATATHPSDFEDGSDPDSDAIADLDLAFDDNDQDSEDDASSNMTAPEFHFVGILGDSGSIESMTEPESILPALQVGGDSEAGSGDTAPMEQDLESEE